MILYGSSLSPFVRKVCFCGREGDRTRGRAVGPGDLNPISCRQSVRQDAGLVDGDYRSRFECDHPYLEAKHPEPVLIPADPKLRGRTIWFDEFGDTILAACGAKMFFNRVVAPRFLNRPGNEDAAASAERDELPPILDYLETVVPDGNGYLVGDSLTLADISVASPFANLAHLDCQLDPARHGRTRAYIERILARPSFAKWVERETAFLAREPA